MNEAQLNAMRLMTLRIDSAARRPDGGWRNGPVVFRTDTLKTNGAPLLFAANYAPDDHSHFVKDVFVGVVFGPRGAATVVHCEGIKRQMIA